MIHRAGSPPKVSTVDVLHLLRAVRATWMGQYLPGEGAEVVMDGLRVYYTDKHVRERRACVQEIDAMIRQIEQGYVVTGLVVVEGKAGKRVRA